MAFEKMSILIVDDISENIQVAVESLKPLETKFLYAKNGEDCISLVQSYLPDLILLDIMMPKMDGFEVCKSLKADEKFKHIPIIFLSSFDEIDDIVQGFDLGAVDYISKPFKSKELIVRVKTHLQLIQLMKKSLENTKHTTMSKLAGGLIHEINTPLTPIKGSLEMMKIDIGSLDESNTKKYLNEELESIENNINRIQKLSNSMYELVEKKEEKLETTDMNHVLTNSMLMLYNSFKDFVQISLNGEIFSLEYKSKSKLLVTIQYQKISQVIIGVLKNSIDAIRANNIQNGKIYITLEQSDKVVLKIEDNGLGVSKEKLKKLFDDPISGDKCFGGIGIGLYVSQKIVHENNGTIEAIKGKEGLIIIVTFPRVTL